MKRLDLSRRVLAISTIVLCAGAGLRGDSLALTRRDADSLQRKIVQITEIGIAPRTKATSAARSTTITEPEVNSYLRYHAASEIPAGVVDPYITIVGDGRLKGTATVDLDAVRKQKERGWLDPLGYVSGRVPVEAAGMLQTRDGVGQFTLQSASIGGVTVPKAVLQEVVSYYSRRPDNPAGISLDAPFELPARIREIKVGTRQATVVQ